MKFLILIIIFSANVSVAQNYLDSSDSYKGLNDLIESALKNNSRLTPVGFQKEAESTKTGQLDKQPAPMLDFTVDMIPTNLENPPRYTTVFAQKLMLPGKLEERGLLGEINAKEQDVIKSQIQVELIKQVKKNYFNLYLNERMTEFNSEFQSIISNIITSQEISYVVGKGKQYQILKSNNELQKLVLEQIELEENKKILINNLKILANEKLPESFKTRNVYLLTRIKPIQLDSNELIKQMRNYNPVYRMIDVKIEENRIEKSIAEYEKTPDIILKTGYRHVSENSGNFLMFGFGIDLSFMPWNTKRIDSKIKEKEILEKKYAAVYETTDQYLLKDVQNKIIKIKSTLDKIKYIREVLIPQTDQTFLSNLGSYESASEDFSNLLDSYRDLREANLMIAEMETMYLIQLSELEFLIGNQIFTIN
ncbi:MAG: TolC family protein [Bacteroidetes bacterium]|nr:TolC family protein [Bacteroidota bacterium]